MYSCGRLRCKLTGVFQMNSCVVRRSALTQSLSTAKLIDGVAISSEIKKELKIDVETLTKKYNACPGLAVVLVGSRKDSETYVKNKKLACKFVGIKSFGVDFPETVTQTELIDMINLLNEDTNVDGILVQLPLPNHINAKNVIETIKKEKDVDGLHPLNVFELMNSGIRSRHGALSLKDVDFSIACTPQGCLELLDRSGISVEGKSVVVLGRSNIVGMPVSLLLSQRNATVTIVHSKTVNPKEVVRGADIVIAAIGKAEMVKGDWLKPGAVVIDVGINHVSAKGETDKQILVGDCDLKSCLEVASRITPVPGGVGPMTIAMLMRNTVNAFKRRVQFKEEQPNYG